MRIPEEEGRIKAAVYLLINRFYTHLRRYTPPEIMVLDDEEFFQMTGQENVRGVYQIMENRILFRKGATPFIVAHEVHHWAQAQMIGLQKFLKEIKDIKKYLDYEAEADEVKLKTAPLIWEML